MIKKICRFLFVPILTFSIFCTTGFCLWVFFLDFKDPITTLNGEILLTSAVDLGKVSFIKPEELDYQEYRIVFEQGKDSDIYDEKKGIYLVPSLEFVFTDYSMTNELVKAVKENDYQFYYYVTFENSGALFNENGYGKYLTSAPGQSYETKLELNVDFTSKITKVSFNPIFEYQVGKKPTTKETYQSMLTAIQQDQSYSIFKVHILLEKR